MKAHATQLIALILCFIVQAASAADHGVGELTKSGGLFASVDPEYVTSKCQPLEGNRVAIIGYKSNVGGMMGLNVVYVQLMDGLCKGQKGFVGINRVKSIHAD